LRMCANGSKTVQGLYYSTSYAPTVDTCSFRLILNIAASDGMTMVFIDASNTFQTNVISDPKKIIYITLATMYLEWFRARFPNQPLAKCKNSKELIMQSLRNIQGIKYTVQMVPIIGKNLHSFRMETKQYMQRSMGILKEKRDSIPHFSYR